MDQACFLPKKAVKPNGNPKVQTANKATTPNLNSFDALSTLVNDEEGGVIKLLVQMLPLWGTLPLYPKKAGIVITEEDNDFLADIMFDEEQEELNATCIMMARIQEVNNDSEASPSYDTDVLSNGDVEQDEISRDQNRDIIESLIKGMQLKVSKCKKANRKAKEQNDSLTVELEKYKE
ncbi:hypothetical protein Tco_0997965 [Tanacetum coccineum]